MNPTKWGAGALAILALVATEAGAQTRPSSGLPGQLPGQASATSQPRFLGQPERPVELEDMIPADPLKLWHAQLVKEKPVLALTADQQPAFDGFARELDDVQRMNAQRVRRAVRRQAPVTTAMVDVERDLRTEAADATDWAAALSDLSLRWRALQKALSPEQRARIDRIYQQSQLSGHDAPPLPH
jgi:hypothetical protein